MNTRNLAFLLGLTIGFPIYLFAQNNTENELRTYLTGDSSDVHTKTQPGLLLAGGSTDVSTAMRWLLERSGGGDVVVIRSSGADGYNQYLFDLAKVNSVETILINSRNKALLPIVAEKSEKQNSSLLPVAINGTIPASGKTLPLKTQSIFLLMKKSSGWGNQCRLCHPGRLLFFR